MLRNRYTTSTSYYFKKKEIVVKLLWNKVKDWNKRQILIISIAVSVMIAIAGIGRLFNGVVPASTELQSPDNSVALASTPVSASALVASAQSPDGTGQTIIHAGESVNATERPPNDKVAVIAHTISSGESLWFIAKKYGVTSQTILAANPNLDPHVLKPGKTIRVPNKIGLYYKVGRKQSLSSIAKAYRIKVEDILLANGLTSPDAVKSGDTIFLPGEKPLLVAFNTQAGYRFPVQGRLTSRFGYRAHPMGGGSRFHTGIDIAAPYGATVVAAESGRVVEAGWQGLLGKTVVIRHSSTYETLYGHNAYLLVRPGEYVKKGQAIACVGSSGLSTGPHVHFEIRKNGKPINPLPYLR
ncbi:MAG: peptidoglycan DD-metalloendopeptidase family protein [bacterium]|nr:peptidoglycan DD-metalloendopeptidase family protein [bacterium]